MSRHPSRSEDFFQPLQGYAPATSSSGAQSSKNSPATPQYPPYHQSYPQQPLYGIPYQNDLQFQQFQAFQQFQLQQTRMNPTPQSARHTQPEPAVETQLEPSQQTQPGPSRKSRAKGKMSAVEKVIKKKSKQPWTSVEEKLLAECWLDVSKDPHIDISQTGETFWNKVFANYNAQAPLKRWMDQISGKWRLIKEQVSKFNSFGTSMTKIEEVAKTIRKSWKKLEKST